MSTGVLSGFDGGVKVNVELKLSSVSDSTNQIKIQQI